MCFKEVLYSIFAVSMSNVSLYSIASLLYYCYWLKSLNKRAHGSFTFQSCVTFMFFFFFYKVWNTWMKFNKIKEKDVETIKKLFDTLYQLFVFSEINDVWKNKRWTNKKAIKQHSSEKPKNAVMLFICT